jgi:hypothetical protein
MTGRYVFITPQANMQSDGVVILDESGDLVYQRTVPARTATSLRVDRYRGQPVLAWWEGDITSGIGDGEFVLSDSTYHDVARIRAVGYRTDLHELVITPDNTALLFGRRDITIDGQPLLDMLVQEVDIATGRLRWEWAASDHITAEESFAQPHAGEVFDFLHANSIDLLPNGDLLVSSRHTSTIYKVTRPSGDVVWRLGGKRSDFTIDQGAEFGWQHDARHQPKGMLSLFDNAAMSPETANGASSRGMVLAVDETAMTAKLVEEYRSKPDVLATSQGCVTRLPDGKAFVGWGSQPRITGHDTDGSVTYSATFPQAYSSYRAFRQDWMGEPTDQPAIVVQADVTGALTAYVSWNGATQVARWELLTGDRPTALAPVAQARRAGFETPIPVTKPQPLVAVRALAANGKQLGVSRPVGIPTA